MKPAVQAILDRVKKTADFGYVDFTDINATNALGENALHCVKSGPAKFPTLPRNL